MRHRMAVLLVDEVLPLDFAIPMHVFARECPQFYDVVTASASGVAVPMAGGSDVVADGGLELLQGARTVVVPGYADAAHRPLDAVVLRALADAARRGARLVSICSGAFALAQAGLLDGRPATTHWTLCAALAERFPRIAVDADALFVDDGDVVTSAGVTAGVDLCLHLLRRDLGPAVANHVSRRIVMAPRTGGQTQFVETPPVPPADDALAATQQWMLAELHRPIAVAEMADRAGLPLRTFHRRFRAQSGRSPLEWLRAQRIERTKELLETTDLSVERIATQVGMGTEVNLRAAFRAATSISPSRYRQQFTQRPDGQAAGSTVRISPVATS